MHLRKCVPCMLLCLKEEFLCPQCALQQKFFMSGVFVTNNGVFVSGSDSCKMGSLFLGSGGWGCYTISTVGIGLVAWSTCNEAEY